MKWKKNFSLTRTITLHIPESFSSGMHLSQSKRTSSGRKLPGNFSNAFRMFPTRFHTVPFQPLYSINGITILLVPQSWNRPIILDPSPFFQLQLQSVNKSSWTLFVNGSCIALFFHLYFLNFTSGSYLITESSQYLTDSTVFLKCWFHRIILYWRNSSSPLWCQAVFLCLAVHILLDLSPGYG